MGRFRTKPFEIEAVQYDGTNFEEVDNFTGNHGMFMVVEHDDFDHDIIASIYDKLHSTWVGVKKGQWIIRGQKGEYYPCDPEIFDAKYEPVSDKWWKAKSTHRDHTHVAYRPPFRLDKDEV